MLKKNNFKSKTLSPQLKVLEIIIPKIIHNFALKLYHVYKIHKNTISEHFTTLGLLKSCIM